MNIQNSVIIVTGASMGIGMETAKLLSEKGATVVLAARSQEKLTELETQIPNSWAVVTDMTNTASIENLIAKTKEKYGKIDCLINNAGQGMYTDLEHINLDDYQKIITLNVFGPLIAMQKVIPIMRLQKGGMIINISSQVSKNYFPYLSAYASTKYALNALTLTSRAELEKDGIVVSLVHPGLTATEFGKNAIKTPSQETYSSRNREGMPKPDSARFVGERIVDAIESGRPETYMHE